VGRDDEGRGDERFHWRTSPGLRRNNRIGRRK